MDSRAEMNTQNYSVSNRSLEREHVLLGEGPLYTQLALGLEQLIEEGTLEQGSRLPAVRSLAKQLDLSCGTVKHAYNLLSNKGYLDQAQGKGSFVRKLESMPSFSRKEEGMRLIEEMITALEHLSFSQREIQIFVELKLRERDERGGRLRVIVTEEAPESRAILMNAFASIPYAEFYPFSIEDVLDGNAAAIEADAIICTEAHQREMELLMSSDIQVLLAGLSLNPETAVALAQIPSSSRVGIICLSKAYAAGIRQACEQFADLRRRVETRLFTAEDLSEFIDMNDYLILPDSYLSFVHSATEFHIQRFQGRGGKLILYREVCERSAFISCRRRLENLRQEREAIDIL